MTRNQTRTLARCRCGQTALAASGPPILTTACYCDSCRKAGAELEALSGAPVLQADGGVGFVLYRKDRVRPAVGADHFREHRLTPDAKTRRVVADCCGAPMFLEFTGGHWLSVYRDRFDPENRPRIQVRTMTGDLGPDVRLDDSAPCASGLSSLLMWRLMVAWAAMGFRAPALDYVKGTAR